MKTFFLSVGLCVVVGVVSGQETSRLEAFMKQPGVSVASVGGEVGRVKKITVLYSIATNTLDSSQARGVSIASAEVGGVAVLDQDQLPAMLKTMGDIVAHAESSSPGVQAFACTARGGYILSASYSNKWHITLTYKVFYPKEAMLPTAISLATLKELKSLVELAAGKL